MAGAAILFIPRNEDPMQQPPPSQPAPAGETRATPSKSDVVRRAVMMDQVTPDGGPPEPGEAAMAGGNPAKATIYVPRAQPIKPQTNDASVQAQWYRQGARANSKDGFK
jgi:hypothetical protein